MILNKKTISINIFFSLFQIVVTGLVYYFLYKFLLQNLGSELMGVWAIVLSISSTVNIANLGIGSGVVRFTALFKADNESENINRLIHTSLLFLAGIFFVIIILVYLVAPLWLHAVISNNYYSSAIAIVPYSLVCLFFNALSGIYASCIDGLQKNYLRSIIFVLSFIVLILFTYLLVPKYGLKGIAYAQLLQSIFLLIAMVCGLKFIFRQHRVFAFIWDQAIFKKIFSFGVKEQIISICQLCFDPFTKSLLGNFGSLSMVTYYEMANRLVLQLRGLLVSANQVFLPVFTNAQEKSAELTKDLYRQVFSINFLLSILWASFIVAAIIPVSKIWLGNVNPQFITITILLTAAYFFNIIISPAYFANMGSAKLSNNLIGNIIIAVLNIILCYTLGYFFNGYGVVAGWCIALAIGSLYIVFTYHHINAIKFNKEVIKKDIIVSLVSLVFALLCISFFYYRSSINGWLMISIVASVFMFVSFIVYRVHPVGKILLNIIRRKGS